MGQMVKIKMMGREGVLHMMMFDERYKRFGIDYENTFLVQEWSWEGMCKELVLPISLSPSCWIVGL